MTLSAISGDTAVVGVDGTGRYRKTPGFWWSDSTCRELMTHACIDGYNGKYLNNFRICSHLIVYACLNKLDKLHQMKLTVSNL